MADRLGGGKKCIDFVFSGSGRWPQSCGLIKRFKRFIKNSYKESKPSCVCTAGFAGKICCFPLIGKFVYP